MVKQPLISVIVPVYNAQEYIGACLDSVLNQNFSDFEIVVINDGSSDMSAEICEEYKRKDYRVKVIHKENTGVSVARQVGINASCGEYIAFVDSDDLVKSNFMELISRHIGVDVIRFGNVEKKQNGTTIYHFPKEREGLYDKNDIKEEIFPYLIQNDVAGYYCPSLWCHVFRRSLFVENMVKDCVIKIGEDGACIMPCIYHAQSLYCMHECLYIYNYNENSATKGKKVFPWDGPMLIAQHLENRFDITSFDFRQQLDRKIVHELFSVVVSQFNCGERYHIVRRKIIRQLAVDEYDKAIRNAKFGKSIKAKFMHIFMKHRFILGIYFYSRLLRS